MAKRKDNSETPGTTAANIGYEVQLWQMADALRGWTPPSTSTSASVSSFSSTSPTPSRSGTRTSTPIPACLRQPRGLLAVSLDCRADEFYWHRSFWFLARDRKNGKFRDRHGHVLFIDARKLGPLVDRTHRELTGEDIARIAGTYHAWRGEKEAGEYADVLGFCKSAPIEEVRKHGHVLTPGRYVGAEAAENDGEPFEEKMPRLTATLREQQAEVAKLDAVIAANLKELGYGG